MRWRAWAAYGVTALILTAIGALPGTRSWATEKAKPVDYNRDILPILSDQCFTCHGPDGNKRDADLRLDTREGLFSDRGGYQTVVPGNPAASELYLRVSTPDDFELMPPSDAGQHLTPAQVVLIKRWIEEGAPYQEHWAYVAPKRPGLPPVKGKSWPLNPIDWFILSRLESEGLRPSREADRATLLRRVSFDLVGLPPTPAQVQAFLSDKSPNAYERQVDRLLASPRYGENMARTWLDVARYADSGGGDVDELRGMWPWRDWVINAYNRNLPYDQFTIKQIAGDLLPDATLEDRIATGFNRNHPGLSSDTGDRVPIMGEERANIVADRVSTTGTTWLGLTVGCARCHDHKYDPIKQKDFYRLAAYFNNVPEFTAGDHNHNTEPVTDVPSLEQQKHAERLDSEIRATLAQLPEQDIVAQENQWRATAVTTIPRAPTQGLLAHYPFEGTLTDNSGHGHEGRLLRDQVAYLQGVIGKAGMFNGTTFVEFDDALALDRSKPFALSFWTNPKRAAKQNLLQKRDASVNWAGLEIALDDPEKAGRVMRLVVRLASRWPDDVLEIRSKERIVHSKYITIENLGAVGQHLVVNYDGSGKAAGLTAYVDGEPIEMEVIKDQLTGSTGTAASLSVGDARLGDPFSGLLDELRVYNRILSAAEIGILDSDAPALSLVQELRGSPVTGIPALREEQPPDGAAFEDDNPSKQAIDAYWQGQQQARLADYFASHGAAPQIRQTYARLKDLRAQRAELERAIPTTMVMAEMDQPMDTFVLGRGQYYNKGEKVSAGVPAFLLPLPADAPTNRLALARWLVDPKNPLTARVAVNRYWQHFFGTGIVKTAEDFGSQGEPPSHPELLDWLATEFIRTGWDVKAMQRLIVLSATYRQSSKLTPKLRNIDPENRLLARGPRVRLAAEEIRDNALAMSGLLVEKLGGPSVYPYQPAELWHDVYNQASGPDLYRRSLYTIWRRSVPLPTLAIFDEPNREVCVARRNLTNTPLQALVLMDDPTFVEASRMFAQRAIQEAGQNPARRLDFLLDWAIERRPARKVRSVLLQEARDAHDYFKQRPNAAQDLLAVGQTKVDPAIDPVELAAWTTVARTVLNMDETITKQ